MVTLLAITVSCAIIGVLLIKCNSDGWGLLLIAIGIVIFITGTVSLTETKAEIQEFKATQATIDRARQNGADLEDAAIQQKIIESNQWLARKQYYNSSIWGLWIPDEVAKLKPIQ